MLSMNYKMMMVSALVAGGLEDGGVIAVGAGSDGLAIDKATLQ